ncbi:type II/IV secretion system protein [Clostridium sp. 19966]|uniref:GspE/PulE family protein n=1 Tax=Clostridium sp. 19966 TaxID=2768166 RepID=UPI0028DF92F5|nr:GspE/PulE family protein [Clostridium sp. 19966]MDT8716601.1 type II/IV secretion system protein [Clostridium sp. 19966]
MENKNIQCINLDSIDKALFSIIPMEFVLKNKILPIKQEENTLFVAVSAYDAEVLGQLKIMTRLNIKCIKIEDMKLKSLIKEAYQVIGINKAMKDLLESIKKVEGASASKIGTKAEIMESPAVKLVEYMINEAIIKNASDIHIEPGENEVKVRYRIDGKLFDALTILNEIYNNIVVRIKILCNMDISEKRIPQDGGCQYKLKEADYDLRISTIPVIFGEKIVIRILSSKDEFSSIEKLYLNKGDVNLLRKLLLKSHGIILVTGPTGSGKTTTLYSMLNELRKRNLNITTIEDPVEYTLQGINQINVNIKAGITFARGLRSILRQDPDVIMIGEIRDEETAAIAIRAAITGHLVISTLHTNGTYATIDRLLEMGIEKYLLADALIAVISQRLVRKICTKCKKIYIPNEEERNILKESLKGNAYKGTGCISCNHSGYHGRVAVSEILMVDDETKRFIMKKNNIYIKPQQSNMIKNAMDMITEGITTIEELMILSNGDIHLMGEQCEKI